MGAKENTFAFYCEVCEFVFRVKSTDLDNASKLLSVACPSCGRKARVQRAPGGGIQVVHGDHIFICPKPLDRNPLITTMVYVAAAVMVALILGVIAKKIGPFLCPVVFFTSLVLIGLVGTMQLATSGVLTGKNFVDLMRIFFKGVPGLLGKAERRGKIVADTAQSVG